jgi:hypothetical protein
VYYDDSTTAHAHHEACHLHGMLRLLHQLLSLLHPPLPPLQWCRHHIAT